MKVAIAGAGAVGRSIARELLGNNHEVLMIDKNPDKTAKGRAAYALIGLYADKVEKAKSDDEAKKLETEAIGSVMMIRFKLDETEHARIRVELQRRRS